jgi:pyruvate carboxylase
MQWLLQTRALYAPFESDLRSSSSDVYYHEMPGGQYTNLKFQVLPLHAISHFQQPCTALPAVP